MSLGQLLIRCGLGSLDIKHSKHINGLRFSGMEVGKLRKLLQPGNGNALRAVGQCFPTTGSDLHQALARNSQQTGLVQVGPGPAHSVVDHRLLPRRQPLFALFLG
ncbi:hypothetical protein D3C76_1396970 [compost metagenome]